MHDITCLPYSHTLPHSGWGMGRDAQAAARWQLQLVRPASTSTLKLLKTPYASVCPTAAGVTSSLATLMPQGQTRPRQQLLQRQPSQLQQQRQQREQR